MGRKTGPSRTVAELVVERSGGLCEKCCEQGEQIHHRRPRGMGGTCRKDTNSPANLVHLCRPCHEWVESNRVEARGAGWLISQHDPRPPSEVLVLLCWGSGYLTDQGGIRVEHPEDAAIRWAADGVTNRSRRDRAA